MKKFTKVLSLLLALTLCLSFPVAASAREVDDPRDGVLIDEDALGIAILAVVLLVILIGVWKTFIEVRIGYGLR